jgi:N-acetylmuramoyl-L-alanine amidase
MQAQMCLRLMKKDAPVRRRTVRQIQRIFALISFLLVTTIVLLAGQSLGLIPQDLLAFADPARLLPRPPQIALISGHAGHDSGAVCTDAAGNVTLTEAEINARVAGLAAQRLRRAGVDVLILDEFDPLLENLDAPLLLSLHADSCIELSGYKAAGRISSSVPAEDGILLDCLAQHYAAATGLLPHPNTITHDMTHYHAFRRILPSTPAAILELGFLGGDQTLLVNEADRVAAGVAESVVCYLEQKKNMNEE